MSASILTAWPVVVLHLLAQVGFILRALWRPHREPSSRLAWVVVILSVPAFGMIAYVLFGETRIGRRRAAEYHRIAREMAHPQDPARHGDMDLAGERHAHLFHLGRSISGMGPVGGNSARLMADGDAAIAGLVADIDAARHRVHLLFYIWLADGNGRRVAEACMRAAQRGVTVRVMADDLGSRKLVKSELWRRMAAAGVRTSRALPVGFLPLHPIRGRVDLRNHRKIAVIDGAIAYCGSQNCADPAFLPKAAYGPWVDLMVRFEGPLAAQNDWLFAADWLAHERAALEELTALPDTVPRSGGVVAQAIGTGPTVRASAMPEMFEALMHAARHELVVTTPYFVPNEAMQSALCAAAMRGVATTIVFPARNDSRIVAAASRSYYSELLSAGVRIHEFPDGLLHAKSLTLDGEVALIGSANLDRRSFELNYENTVLLRDTALTADLRARQQRWIDASRLVTREEVEAWSSARHLWYNAVAMLGPVL